MQVIQGIVLAAGMGRRIGMHKALLTLRDQTLHHRAVSVLLGAGLDVVVVVNEVVNEALPPPGAGERRLINHDPDQAAGMYSSVRLGVAKAVRAGATGALLLPVDHPLVSREDVAAVMACLGTGAAIVVATHEGRRGHPVGVSAPVMAEILAEPLSSTLRDIVRRDPSRVVEVAASEGVLVGINTRDDLERVSNRTFR